MIDMTKVDALREMKALRDLINNTYDSEGWTRTVLTHLDRAIAMIEFPPLQRKQEAFREIRGLRDKINSMSDDSENWINPVVYYLDKASDKIESSVNPYLDEEVESPVKKPKPKSKGVTGKRKR